MTWIEDIPAGEAYLQKVDNPAGKVIRLVADKGMWACAMYLTPEQIAQEQEFFDSINLSKVLHWSLDPEASTRTTVDGGDVSEIVREERDVYAIIKPDWEIIQIEFIFPEDFPYNTTDILVYGLEELPSAFIYENFTGNTLDEPWKVAFDGKTPLMSDRSGGNIIESPTEDILTATALLNEHMVFSFNSPITHGLPRYIRGQRIRTPMFPRGIPLNRIWVSMDVSTIVGPWSEFANWSETGEDGLVSSGAELILHFYAMENIGAPLGEQPYGMRVNLGELARIAHGSLSIAETQPHPDDFEHYLWSSSMLREQNTAQTPVMVNYGTTDALWYAVYDWRPDVHTEYATAYNIVPFQHYDSAAGQWVVKEGFGCWVRRKYAPVLRHGVEGNIVYCKIYPELFDRYTDAASYAWRAIEHGYKEKGMWAPFFDDGSVLPVRRVNSGRLDPDQYGTLPVGETLITHVALEFRPTFVESFA